MNKKNNRLLVLIVLVSCFFNSYAFNRNDVMLSNSTCQCRYYFDSILQCNIYTSVDTMPRYEGGPYQLSKDLMRNVDLNKMTIFQTSVIIEYVIGIDGNVIMGKIANKKENELSGIEIEFLEALKFLDKWVPGKCNGKNVPVKLREKIRFSPPRSE